jgi:surfactin synthase thioesterase subunit
MKWLLREPAAEAGARLFCIPYSGCGASMYRSWPRWIGDIEVCPVQLPGRESRFREEPFESYEALAASLGRGLSPYLDRPFAFFGHCASALPGYETALWLADQDFPTPMRLFVSSQVAPHEGPHGRFLGMTDEELTAELAELVVRLGGTPRPDLLALSLVVLRRDVEVNKAYRPGSPRSLPCPVTTIGWDADVEVDHRLMSGWAACGEVTARVLAGPHYGFIDAPAELLSAFAVDMGRAEALSALDGA